jgi:hypothetical protein
MIEEAHDSEATNAAARQNDGDDNGHGGKLAPPRCFWARICLCHRMNLSAALVSLSLPTLSLQDMFRRHEISQAQGVIPNLGPVSADEIGTFGTQEARWPHTRPRVAHGWLCRAA